MKKQAERQDELGAVKWLLLAWVLLYGLFSLITWPFRLVYKHWPGRREKKLREAVDERRASIPGARQLIAVLSAGAADLQAKLERKIEKMDKDLDRLLADQGWPDEMESDEPWGVALDLLEKAKYVAGIDWKASPDELKAAMAPLLKKRGLSFDWAFVQELERMQRPESLRNENLLPTVASKLAAAGYVLAHLDDGSDNFNFALCTPEEFSRVESLSSGGYSVRAFAKPGTP